MLRAKGTVSLAAPQPFPALPVLSLAVTCACSDPVPFPSCLVLPTVEGASPGWTVLLLRGKFHLILSELEVPFSGNP